MLDQHTCYTIRNSEFCHYFLGSKFQSAICREREEIKANSSVISHFQWKFEVSTRTKLTDKIHQPQHRAPHAVWWHWPMPNLEFPWVLVACHCYPQTTGNTNRKIHRPAISTRDDPFGRTHVTYSPCSTPARERENKKIVESFRQLSFMVLWKTNLFFD